MYGVFLHIGGEIGADGAGGGIFRVGGAHGFAVRRNRVFAF